MLQGSVSQSRGVGDGRPIIKTGVLVIDLEGVTAAQVGLAPLVHHSTIEQSECAPHHDLRRVLVGKPDARANIEPLRIDDPAPVRVIECNAVVSECAGEVRRKRVDISGCAGDGVQGAARQCIKPAAGRN